MSKSYLGTPCWYELATSQGTLPAAAEFYGQVFGWAIADAGMEGFDYRLASAGGDAVAGLMEMPGDVAGMPPFWMIYFAVDDIEALVRDATAAGARIHRPLTDIPGTGRFALLADPQGAGFGVLQPDMSTMSEAEIAKAESGQGAFNPGQPGRGHWHELMSTDPEAAFAFYAGLFGWGRGSALDMGADGAYQIFRHGGADIGGMMGLGGAPGAHWLPYFGIAGSVTRCIDTISAAGGQLHHGPREVPGAVFIAIARDPQGAAFAVIGPTL